jgi:hypothetical protein
MYDRSLVIIFIALTTVAILIQTGILAGFFFLSTKLSRQADQALDVSRNLLGPLHKTAENLQAVSARVAEFGASTHEHLRNLESWWRRAA